MDNKFLSFMLYVYFGNAGKNKKEMIEMAVKRAYRDFNRTIDFNDEYKNLSTDNTKTKNEKAGRRKGLVDKVTEMFIRNIKSLKTKSNQKEFDKWHKDRCNYISKIYKDKVGESFDNEKTLYYGQQQKWINMTLKYLYVIYNLKGIDDLNEVYKYFHIPVDSVVLDNVENIEIPKDEKNKNKCWSKWNKEEYLNFQKEMRKNIKDKALLDWEFENWKPKNSSQDDE